MDKINLTNWNDAFGYSSQQIIFASKRYTDLHFQFEEPGLASGFMKTVGMPGMQFTEIFLNTDRQVQLVDNSTIETAESIFVLDGAAESNFYNLPARVHCNKNQHNFQYSKQLGGEHTINPNGFHALAITYELQFLKQLLQDDDSDSIGQLANCVNGQKTYLASPGALAFQGRISDVLANIRNSPFAGVTRYLFLESKMMELFALQLQQVQTIGDRKYNYQWTAGDIEKLHAVKDYVENNYLKDFSLKDLTYKFSLNEFKLKKGYKQLFQSTVFGHVLQLRMQRAKALLQQKAMNVSQAAFFIGYDNVSSFCAEFKKRFGYSPGKFNSSSIV